MAGDWNLDYDINLNYQRVIYEGRVRDGVKGEQKSAEGVFAITHDGEGPNVMSGLRT